MEQQEQQSGENNQATPNAAGGGQQPGGQVFTQQQVNELIAQRLRREAAKYEDYDELKAAAEKWATHQAEQQTEAEKFKAQLDKAQRERDQALQQAQATLIKAAVMAEAAKQGATHPEDVFALANLSEVTVDKETGQVVGAEAAVKAVVEAGRVPMQDKRAPQAPALQGGAGGNAARPAPGGTLTPEEQAMALKLRVTPEAYLKRKQELEKTQ